MARSFLFSRLRRLAARALWAHRAGATSIDQLYDLEDRFPREPREPREPRAPASGVTRRGLGRLALAAAGVAMTGAGGCVGDDGFEGEGESAGENGGDGPRIVIVGGGIAGLHCAYRLAAAGVQATVYDAWDRLGGRIFSTAEGAPEGMILELGGELIDSHHATLWGLADELGILLKDREEGVPVGELWWVDDAEVPEATILEQFLDVAPQLIADYEAAETDDDAFDALNHATLKSWLESHVPLATHRELHTVIEVAYRGEYGLETPEQSALNLIYLLGDDTATFRIFGESDERYHTEGGNQRLIDGMAAALADDQVRLGHRLVAAADHGDGGYRLTFVRGDDDEEVEVIADHVVFALPFTLLRQCDLESLTLSDEKRRIIAELGYGTNTKVMGSFSAPIWREVHGRSGSVTADRSFQQCWDTAITQEGAAGIMTNFLGGAAGVDAGVGSAEAWYTTHLVAGLEAIFPGSAAAYNAGSAVRMHWPTAPFHRGSYTCYRPGQWDFWAREGIREGDLHFCGEHCSPEFQGWMEGAAESGAAVAAELLDDLGVAASPAHRALIDRLTAAAPHPCYHGDRQPRRRGSPRGRLLQRPARRLVRGS